MTVPIHPVLDSSGVVVKQSGGVAQAHPCGDCTQYSIYGVCWRENGCGVTECEADFLVATDVAGYCTDVNFVFTATRLKTATWGPYAAPATGTVTVEWFVDHASVKGPTQQNVVESIEYTDVFTWPAASYFASGWHAIKAVAIWKDSGGIVVEREDRTLCVFAGIRPSGEDEIALHDVVILPGSGNEVCISETLRAVKLLGPYRSWSDADFVRTEWWTTIDPYTRLCLCPNTCASGETDLSGSLNSDFDPGNTVLEAANYIGFTGCTPSIYPIYVQFTSTFTEPGGCSFYMKYYDSEDNEIGETEIEDATAYDFVVPPCTRVEFVLVNSNESAAYCQIGYTLGYYSNFPNPDAQEECPYEDTITDLVPANATELIAWLEEQE